jgi:hypothetical protein
MPHRMFARQLLDELARRLGLRSAPQHAGPQSAASDALSDPRNERAEISAPDVGTRLHLVSLGVVAAAIVVVFFGLGFFLLAHPSEELIAGAGNRGVEVEPQRSDFDPPLETARGSLSASAGTSVAASAASDASYGQGQPGLTPNADEAALTTPTEITHAKRNPIGRYRHAAGRMHRVGVSHPGAKGHPPQSASGPEKAWHWIVQSATSILAALSPPSPRQAPSPKNR